MVKQSIVKEWIELLATGPKSRKDEAAQVLTDAGASGVLEADTSQGLQLKAYIEPEVFAGSKAEVRRSLKNIGWKFSFLDYIDEDWPLRWKRSVKTMAVAGFFIRPTWSNAKVKSNHKLITLDPGQAFGTGSHDTTRMCMRALALLLARGGKLNPKKVKLLDVGTGSAILAVAAKLLGVKEVLGIDNDPVALSVARKNRRENNLTFSISGKDISQITGRYDVVVANILSSILSGMKNELIGRVRPGGYLILSGILKSEGDELLEGYSTMKLYKRLNSGEWTSFILKKADRR